jgi:hypothetical protein
LEKPKIVITGFYARGNCGDEALLQCAYEAFSPDFAVTISVDGHGAFKPFWDWYPYNDCKVIHQNNLGYLDDHTLAGLLVCGGGLPVGFVADQILSARSAGMPVVALGIDRFVGNASTKDQGRKAVDQYRSLFDRIYYRTVAWNSSSSLSASEHIGGDWAMNLIADASPEVEVSPSRVLISVREYKPNEVDEAYIDQIRQLVDGIFQAGFVPTWLPFSPEDVRFLADIGIKELCPMIEEWSNARRVLQIIKSSGATISVGRLHPLIFAAQCEAPVIALRAEVNALENTMPKKIMLFCAELGLPYASNNSELFEWLKQGPKVSDLTASAVKRNRHRLDASISATRQLLLQRHAEAGVLS